MRVLWALVLVVLSLCSPTFGSERPDYNGFFTALRVVECGDVKAPRDGDGGKAIGPYQIWRVYFDDALAADPSIRSLTYQDCRDPDAAAMVVGAYLRRYAPEAYTRGDWEILSRIHNGGPKGHTKRATEPYWARVRKALGASPTVSVRKPTNGRS